MSGNPVRGIIALPFNRPGAEYPVRTVSLFCLAILLAGCGDPHNTIVPADLSQWRDTVRPSLQKLTAEEQELFAQYARRHTILADEVGLNGEKADPIPEGMTLGKAIEEQRSYNAKEQAMMKSRNHRK